LGNLATISYDWISFLEDVVILNLILENSLLFAIVFCILRSLANSFGDALYFSNNINKYNGLWHWIKWGIDRPSLFLFGFFSYNTIICQITNDFWHYTDEFLVWAGFFIGSFFIWQIHYRYWRKKFKAISRKD